MKKSLGLWYKRLMNQISPCRLWIVTGLLAGLHSAAHAMPEPVRYDANGRMLNGIPSLVAGEKLPIVVQPAAKQVEWEHVYQVRYRCGVGDEERQAPAVDGTRRSLLYRSSSFERAFIFEIPVTKACVQDGGELTWTLDRAPARGAEAREQLHGALASFQRLFHLAGEKPPSMEAAAEEFELIAEYADYVGTLDQRPDENVLLLNPALGVKLSAQQQLETVLYLTSAETDEPNNWSVLQNYQRCLNEEPVQYFCAKDQKWMLPSDFWSNLRKTIAQDILGNYAEDQHKMRQYAQELVEREKALRAQQLEIQLAEQIRLEKRRACLDTMEINRSLPSDSVPPMPLDPECPVWINAETDLEVEIAKVDEALNTLLTQPCLDCGRLTVGQMARSEAIMVAETPPAPGESEGEACVDYSVEEQQCRTWSLEGFKALALPWSALATGETRVGADFYMLSGTADDPNSKIWSTGDPSNEQDIYLAITNAKEEWTLEETHLVANETNALGTVGTFASLAGLGPVPQLVTAVLGVTRGPNGDSVELPDIPTVVDEPEYETALLPLGRHDGNTQLQFAAKPATAEAVDEASVQLQHNVKVQQARRFGFRAGLMRTQGYEQIDVYTQGGFVLDETGSKTYANGLPQLQTTAGQTHYTALLGVAFYPRTMVSGGVASFRAQDIAPHLFVGWGLQRFELTMDYINALSEQPLHLGLGIGAPTSIAVTVGPMLGQRNIVVYDEGNRDWVLAEEYGYTGWFVSFTADLQLARALKSFGKETAVTLE